MSTAVQFRRGTTAEHANFTGAVGEITVDVDKKVPVIHDGITLGGFPLLRSGVIVNTDIASNAAIAGSKISPIFTADVELQAQKTVRFLDADSSHWVAFRAPDTVAANLTWTLPATNAAGALTNDGSGTLSWSASGVSLGLAVALG